MSLWRMLLGLLLLASPAVAADLVTPRGSAFAMVPPAGFVPAGRFSGFEDPARGASFLFMELPPAAYDQLVPGLADSDLAAKGIAVDSREAFPVAGGDGQLLVGTQREGAAVMDKWMLVFRAPAFTGMVAVTLPQGAAPPLGDAEVRAALGSIAIVGATAADRIAALPFTVTETEHLRLAGVLAGSAAMFTPDGQMAAGARPFAVVAASLGAAPPPAEREALAITAVRTITGYGDITVDGTEEVLLAGAPTIRLRAHGTDPAGGAGVAIVQWMTFAEKGYTRIVGIADTDGFAAVLPEIEALAASVRLR